MVGGGSRPGSADAGPPIRRIVLQSKEGDLQQQLEELVASLKAGEGARQAAQERKEKERLLAESALLLGIGAPSGACSPPPACERRPPPPAPCPHRRSLAPKH